MDTLIIRIIYFNIILGDRRGIYEVEWVGIIANIPTRRLINQSHAFFTQLQAEASKEVDPKTFVKYSQLYRSALDECTQALLEEGKILFY